ncbi:MAG: GIY-YIG nuclease family protein [Desulfobulbaceae bacterium]|nr:GIY-YIG nuclease family protein [Desulfobulbaceae bacterium]
MIDFVKELDAILRDDPLGLLSVKPKPSAAMSADDRLVASFEEINAFLREHGREPTSCRDIGERRLYKRLEGIRNKPEIAKPLAEYDVFGLLGEVEEADPVELNTVDDVLEHDTLGLLDGAEDEADPIDIFKLTHVSKPADKPDYVAKRKKCKEFAQFEPLFKQVHSDLASGKKETLSFTSERQIVPGAFFLVQGMLVYVANQGEWEKKNFGNVNARLYCVFENGTESNMLLRSLAAALWKDENSRHVVDAKQMKLFDDLDKIATDDEATGYIYVLKSLSEDPKIQEIENLYKVGFSSQPVQQRIQNAAQEPTYLMANVKLVTEYQTFNLNPHKMELLLHTFLAKSCLNIDVYDDAGKRYTPREWFIVPLRVIETAVQLLTSGEILYYRYDHERQEIVER